MYQALSRFSVLQATESWAGVDLGKRLQVGMIAVVEGRVQGYLVPSSHPVTASFQAHTQSQSHSKLPPSHSLIPSSHPVIVPVQTPTQSQSHSKLPPSHSLIPSSHPVTASFQSHTQSQSHSKLPRSHAAFESGRKPGRSSLGTSLVAHSFGFSDA